MTKRDVIRLVLSGQRPPYVPWSMGFTKEAKERLRVYYGCADVEVPLENHLVKLGSDIGFFTDLADDPEKLAGFPDRFRVFRIGFSLYERRGRCAAWQTS